MEKKLRISIITPSYNQGKFIEKTIQSVMAQNYINFEHIIIDGGSIDETVDILKKYPHLKWVSEKDCGQADALNKGFKLVTGDVIGWINSDDYYLPGAFNIVEKAFYNKNVDWGVGNLKYFYTTLDKLVPITTDVISYQALIENPDIVKQQSTFYRKSIIEKVGGWNNNLFMVMDFDLWIRLAKISMPIKLNSYLAVFVRHPDQKTTPRNIFKQTKEILTILNKENVAIKYMIRLVLKKLKSYVHNILKNLLIRFKLIDKSFSSIPFRMRKT